MSQQALSTARKPGSSLGVPKSPDRIDRLTPQLRQACDDMVWHGLDYAQAATKANLHVRSMRLALDRPHVLKYLREQRQVLLGAEGTRTIHRLAVIRDAADNMPAVNAAKLLLDLESEANGGNKQGQQAITPGITIQINTIAPRAAQANERQPVTIEGESGGNTLIIAPDDASSHEPA